MKPEEMGQKLELLLALHFSTREVLLRELAWNRAALELLLERAQLSEEGWIELRDELELRRSERLEHMREYAFRDALAQLDMIHRDASKNRAADGSQ